MSHSDDTLDFSSGFQLLHAVYNVEHLLHHLVRRKCNFRLVFFESNRSLCIPEQVQASNLAKYTFARAVILRHLKMNLQGLGAGISVHEFDSYTSPEFEAILNVTGKVVEVSSAELSINDNPGELYLQSYEIWLDPAYYGQPTKLNGSLLAVENPFQFEANLAGALTSVVEQAIGGEDASAMAVYGNVLVVEYSSSAAEYSNTTSALFKQISNEPQLLYSIEALTAIGTYSFGGNTCLELTSLPSNVLAYPASAAFIIINLAENVISVEEALYQLGPEAEQMVYACLSALK